jgi:hypothetical protein
MVFFLAERSTLPAYASDDGKCDDSDYVALIMSALKNGEGDKFWL